MKIDIGTLPNVNGIPGDFQSRINWIRNNEALNGASTRYGCEGELNRAPVQLQENIVFLYEGLSSVSKFTNSIYTDVESIKKTLELTTDTDAITQVYKNRDEIAHLDNTVEKHSSELFKLTQTQTSIKSDIGTYDPVLDPKYRTVRGDIAFIKKELGSYPGQNINGDPEEGAESTGMKYRIISNSSAIADVKNRVTILETKFSDSDVGTLSTRIDKIRSEIGPESLASEQNLYTRANNFNKEISLLKENQSDISLAIDLSNQNTIGSRVKALEARTLYTDSIVSSADTGLVDRVGRLESKIGESSDPNSLIGQMATIKEGQESLEDIVGRNSSTGLRGQMAWTIQKIGPEDGSDLLSIEGRLKSTVESQNVQESSIQDIQTEIGNSTSGLKGDVRTLKLNINGDPSSTNTVDKDGILSTVKKIDSDYLKDVSDIDTYIRTKNQWIKKSMAIGKFTEANSSVDLSSSTSNYSYVFSKNLVGSSFNNRVARINDDIVVDDSTVYKITVTSVINSENSSGLYSIRMNINDVDSSGIGYGVKTINNLQVLKFEFTGPIESSSRLKFFITGENTEARKVISIKNTVIDISPVL